MQFFRALVLALAVSLALPSYAQQLPGVDPLTVTITPQYPRPYEIITIQPGSTLIDLSSSNVTISVNGTIIEEGSGTRPVTAQLGAAGSRSVVRVTAKAANGQTYSKEITLRPADVSLVIEPVTTAHPFYDGAKLVAPEGRVRIVALPEFAGVSPANLVYTWKNGDRILQNQSGIGKSVLEAVAPVRYRDARITVTVSTQDRSQVGSAVVTVSPIDPILRVYRTGPLLGPSYETAITNNYTMPGTEDSFRVVPYFFASAPAIAWTVNGTGGEKKQDLTVRITEQGRGTARVSVSAKGASVFQSADQAFSLTFGAERTGIFGF